MNRLFSTLLLLATALNMAAVPAKRVTRTITLSNGQSVTVTLRGDEHCKYFKLPMAADSGVWTTTASNLSPTQISPA